MKKKTEGFDSKFSEYRFLNAKMKFKKKTEFFKVASIGYKLI